MIVGLIAMIAGVALCALVRPELPRTAETRWGLVILGIVIALYAGFRDGDRVNDYVIYVDMYEGGLTLVEPTFTLIALFVRHCLGDNVLFLFVIYAAIAVTLKLVAIERITPLMFFAVMIWLADTFPLHELTQIRTGVATGFFLLSIKPLYERKGVKFFLLILCATLFHVSSMLAFFLWFLSPGRINKPMWIAFIVVGYGLAMAQFDLFRLALYIPVSYVQEKVAMYLELQKGMSETVNPFGVGFLGKMVLTLFLLWRVEQIAFHNKYVYLLLKIMFIAFISLLLFSTNLAAGLRFHEFFRTAEILLFPLLYYTVRQKTVAWATLVLLAGLLLFVQITRYELIMPLQ